MYKVAIIDDEPIIVEGISRIIPWQEKQCEVVATANDGVEGTRIIKEYNPNIVITDIAMPDLDGLRMIAGLKSEFPDMQIIILTGFRDFDYAQKAIQLGVLRFLLKPSSLEEIEEAVTAACNNLLDRGITSTKEDLTKNHEEADAKTANSFIVKTALDYIDENYARRLTLADVAEKTYVSQWHLSKLLNKHTGQNFSEILNGKRIDEAKRLLANPVYRIGEIAEKVGFVDLAHFSRVFKRQAGIPANEYRNKILSKGK